MSVHDLSRIGCALFPGRWPRREGQRVTVDLTEYFMHDVERIVGILMARTSGDAAVGKPGA